jgi:hypothetical protein
MADLIVDGMLALAFCLLFGAAMIAALALIGLILRLIGK